MRMNRLSAVLMTVALSGYVNISMANQAGDQSAGHNWVPKPVDNVYWQAPNWSNFNFSPTPRRPPAPVAAPPQRAANNYQRPAMPPQNYRPQRPPMNNYYRPPAQQYNPNMNRPRPPMKNPGQGYPPPPRGPYSGMSDNGASAYNVPGYHRYRRGNSWNRNKFWGRTGPSKWMHPNKDNLEQGWDDMINAPSRMGKMPGGWYAPEVTMPNPVDMGDQMQDNIKDLPEQVKNMDVGNDVKD